MRTLKIRVSKLEEAHRLVPVPVDLPPLTDAEMETRWEALQHRAALGAPDARWRVERINFFLQRAQARAQGEKGAAVFPDEPP